MLSKSTLPVKTFVGTLYRIIPLSSRLNTEFRYGLINISAKQVQRVGNMQKNHDREWFLKYTASYEHEDTTRTILYI